MADDTITLNCFNVARETEKAIYADIQAPTAGVTGIWVPKSVIHDDSETYQIGTSGTLVVARWWAVKNGMLPYAQVEIPDRTRSEDGFINNCALSNGHDEADCQMCQGRCIDTVNFPRGGQSATVRLLGPLERRAGLLSRDIIVTGGNVPTQVTYCSVCVRLGVTVDYCRQFESPSGMTCKRGHGGAEGWTKIEVAEHAGLLGQSLTQWQRANFFVMEYLSDHDQDSINKLSEVLEEAQSTPSGGETGGSDGSIDEELWIRLSDFCRAASDLHRYLGEVRGWFE